MTIEKINEKGLHEINHKQSLGNKNIETSSKIEQDTHNVTPEYIREKIGNPDDAIHQYVKGLIASFMQFKDQDLIDDLAQDVLFKIWQKADSFIEGTALNGWVYSITRNTFLDYIKSKKIRHTKETTGLEENHISESSLSPTETEIIDDLDNKKFLDSLKQKISSDEYKLLEMRFIQQLSIQEIVSKLGGEENALRVRLFRLLQKIKKIYKVK